MPSDDFSLDIDSILAEFSAEDTALPQTVQKKDVTDTPPQTDATVVFTPEEMHSPDAEREVKTYRPDRAVRTESEKETKKNENEDSGRNGSFLHILISAAGAALMLACLFFTLINVHPASGSSSALKKTDNSINISESINNYAKASSLAVSIARQQMIETAEANAAAIEAAKVHYVIPENNLVAPTPDAASFGSAMPDNAAEIMNVIQRARESGLLEGQETVFNTGINFRKDTAIQYYLDDTLLVICWKEINDGNTCSCIEIKMADASQMRRKFADDAFGASNTYYATDLAKSVNAVAALNADYYLFRDFGIVVYNRELYRFNESVYSGEYKKYNCVDTCFVNEDGDLLYFRKGQISTEDEVRQYIKDNRIVFSIAFGPVLVEDGEALYTDWYPVGEIDKGYSRAGFGQVDSLHYLYMGLNHSSEKEARWNINTFAQKFAEKNVKTAYAFDGGQTGEIVFQGTPYNYIDFGAERLVSDIIYFATAIPSGEVTG